MPYSSNVEYKCRFRIPRHISLMATRYILAAWNTATPFWFLNDLKYVITVPYELILYPITIWETIVSCLCTSCEQRWGRFCSKISSQECLYSKQHWKTECLPAGQKTDLSVLQVNKNNPMGRLPLKVGHFPSSRLRSCDTRSQHRHNLPGRLRNGLPWTWPEGVTCGTAHAGSYHAHCVWLKESPEPMKWWLASLLACMKSKISDPSHFSTHHIWLSPLL